MRRWLFAAGMAALLLALPAPIAGARERAADRLDAYTAVVPAQRLGELGAQGYDITGARQSAGGVELQLILTQGQRAKLARRHHGAAHARQGRADGEGVRRRPVGPRVQRLAFV